MTTVDRNDFSESEDWTDVEVDPDTLARVEEYEQTLEDKDEDDWNLLGYDDYADDAGDE